LAQISRDDILTILSRLDRIVTLLEVILKNQVKDAVDIPSQLLDAEALMALPDHLRRTADIVLKMGRVMAQDVADVTKRAQAVESSYLNQLCRMGYLKSERDGRKVFFWVDYDPLPMV